MYKAYFKQAIQMLKQNRFFSAVYIIGTGLAISMVMMVAIIYYFRTANIAPESYRDRMMIVKHGQTKNRVNDHGGSSRLSYKTVKECFYPMQIPEAVCAVIPVGMQSEFIQKIGSKEIYNGLVMGTDASFWKLFEFTFLSGQSYTEEEFASAIRKAVVNESMARKLFNTTDAAGKSFSLNFEEYTVSGVVKDVPSIANYCYAEIWIPFTNRPSVIKGGDWAEGLLGPMHVYILAKSRADFDRIDEEAEKLCTLINTTTTDIDLVLNGQPDTILESFIHTDSWGKPDYKSYYIAAAIILLILLLVPAVNLTGMTSSRMKKRMEELGVRKAFGARNRTLLTQILFDNMILTLLGGVIGLLISYGLIYGLKGWLLNSYNWDGSPLAASIDLSPGMFINPAVFGYTFLFCLILNLLSALLPAWRALQQPVVIALNDK